jgi:hypothetical protein
MSALPSEAVKALSRHWTGRLAHFRQHQNDEHCEALIAEALRYVGIRLESELSGSAYWKDRPLSRRVAVLLYLVDRGAVLRRVDSGRVVFDVADGAEEWVKSQPMLGPYHDATLALLRALRREHSRRLSPPAE